MSECCTCRYKWTTGSDGSHSCSTVLAQANGELWDHLLICISLMGSMDPKGYVEEGDGWQEDYAKVTKFLDNNLGGYG